MADDNKNPRKHNGFVGNEFATPDLDQDDDDLDTDDAEESSDPGLSLNEQQALDQMQQQSSEGQ